MGASVAAMVGTTTPAAGSSTSGVAGMAAVGSAVVGSGGMVGSGGVMESGGVVGRSGGRVGTCVCCSGEN